MCVCTALVPGSSALKQDRVSAWRQAYKLCYYSTSASLLRNVSSFSAAMTMATPARQPGRSFR